MMTVEIITILLSIGAIAISVIAIVKSNNAAKTANDLTKGQVEMQIREMISSARRHYADMATKLPNEDATPVISKLIASALEDVRNAYDESCAKYIDGKVDKERFKKLYVTEIRNLVESESTKSEYIQPQSKYEATCKVYKEWNCLEN
ncbi:MAG: hypothetical protein LBP75_09770 [Planctomycetota bacterium]|jgi:hypothetical protein|nr:hypothetical protein [Planctomycetota bacterium]